MGTDPQVLGAHAQVQVPPAPGVHPVFEPPGGFRGQAEPLHLHLLELPGSEHELPGGDLVAKRLADLRHSEGKLAPGDPQHVGEIDEDPLGGLRTQVDQVLLGLHRSHVGAEHQVEVPGIGEGLPLAARRALVGAGQLVLAEPLVTAAALHQRIGEHRLVPRRLPHPARLDDRRVDSDHVPAGVHHRPPPFVLDVAQHLHAQRPVVVGRPKPPVDLRGGEGEPAAAGQVDDGFHAGHERQRKGYRDAAARRTPVSGRICAPSAGTPPGPPRSGPR